MVAEIFWLQMIQADAMTVRVLASYPRRGAGSPYESWIGEADYGTCRLKVARPSAPTPLPAQISAAFAAITLIAATCSGNPVHEPVHESLRPPANGNYASLL